MNNEQRRVEPFQAHPMDTTCGAQPEGLGLLLRQPQYHSFLQPGYTTLIPPCRVQKQPRQNLLDSC